MGEVLSIEQVELNVNNPTYDKYNFEVLALDGTITPFATIQDGKIYIANYEDVKHLLSDINNKFVIKITVLQLGAETLTYDYTIEVFAPINSIDIDNYGQLADLQVDRLNARGDDFNAFTFDLIFNNGYYTTKAI